MPQDCKKFTLRLYDDKDQDLLDWLNSQRPGEQGEIIKKLLRVSLDKNVDEKHISEPIQSGAPIDVEGLAEEVSKLLLPELRQVFEASLASQLVGLKPSGPDRNNESLKEDARATEALNLLSSTLTVNDDED